MTRTVRVELGSRSYDITIGPGLLGTVGAVARGLILKNARRAAVVSDSTVAPLYGPAVRESLAQAGLDVTMLEFPAGEAHKTLATYGRLVDGLLTAKPPIDRDALVVALGGGVAGDMAGFVAATALRGLRWMQCPTTLLADVDASVGGKTGVDHASGKNLIGAFHQPSAVVIDVATLKTLSPEQLRDGLAECVKHAAIRDWAMLDFLEANREAIARCEPATMTRLVGDNVAIKAAVVSGDEREAGARAHLNFGHTVGHAIETLDGLGSVSHGQCVAWGMIAACEVARRRNLCGNEIGERIAGVLRNLGLRTSRPGLDAARIWQIMQHDKKARQGRVRMVLPRGPGNVEIFDDILESEIEAAVAALGAGK